MTNYPKPPLFGGDEPRPVFMGDPPRLVKLARRTDPETSKKAARAVAKTLGARQRWALEVVRRYGGGLTATEMSSREEIGDPRVLNRRLSELCVLGLVRRGASRPCGVTGQSAATYWEAE